MNPLTQSVCLPSRFPKMQDEEKIINTPEVDPKSTKQLFSEQLGVLKPGGWGQTTPLRKKGGKSLPALKKNSPKKEKEKNIYLKNIRPPFKEKVPPKPPKPSNCFLFFVIKNKKINKKMHQPPPPIKKPHSRKSCFNLFEFQSLRHTFIDFE